MGTVRVFQTNFVAGQIDPYMAARQDVPAYAAAGSDLLNNAPLLEGGLQRRPGTDFVASLAENARLYGFFFDNSQMYLLAFADGNIYIFNNDTLIQTISSVPWTTEYDELEIVSVGDTIFIAHENFAMQKLVRTGATTFVLSDYEFETSTDGNTKYQPYYKFADPGMTIDPSGTTGSVTITASADYWTDDHNGTIIRYSNNATNAKVEILLGARTSATVINGTIRGTLPAHTASTFWDEQVFSDVHGYARSVGYHNDRLIWGGSFDLPEHVFMSSKAAPFNFDTGSGNDDESIQQAIGIAELRGINHIFSGRHLQIFCDTGEAYVPESTTNPLTPANFFPRKTGNIGCSPAPIVEMDGASLFVQRTGKQVREYLYTDLEQAYTADSICTFASSVVNNIVSCAGLNGTDERPEQLAFFVNGDGSMGVFHGNRRQKIAAWFKWQTLGSYRSVATIDEDVYFLVERELDGSTVFCVEKLNFDRVLDCCIVPTNAGNGSWTGLATLEGETVSLVNSQYYFGDATVSSGAITLSTGPADIATYVPYVGLGFTRNIVTMPLVHAFASGPLVGIRRFRLPHVTLQLKDAQDVTVQGQTLTLRTVSSAVNAPPAPGDGLYRFSLLGSTTLGEVRLTWTTPLNCVVLGVISEVYV